MPTSILATKLYVPPPRPGGVLRPRLIERLNEGLFLGRRLTLISAAAGFGKTTLVSEWLAGCGRPVAWLSLDEGDSDPNRFLTYLVAALQTVAAGIGQGVLEALQSPQPPSTESILTTLINEIATLSDTFILALDDYHAIEARPVAASTDVDAAQTLMLEPGHCHPRGSPSTPGPSARPRPTDRAARCRIAFYSHRGRRVSQPGDGPRPLCR